MEWIGDIERAIATNLYPLRLPIAVALLVGLVVLVSLTRRRGWFASARRHPGRTSCKQFAVQFAVAPLG